MFSKIIRHFITIKNVRKSLNCKQIFQFKWLFFKLTDSADIFDYYDRLLEYIAFLNIVFGGVFINLDWFKQD